MRLEGRNVAITGSRTGIGWALAREFARKGAVLHLIQRSWSAEQVQQLRAIGAKGVHEWTCDLRETNEVLKLGSALGPHSIDILINNAGVLTGDLIERQSVNEIIELFQVNLVSAILLTRSLLPGMIERRSGLIVNNTSVSAIMRFPCASTYAASKSGLLAFTECLEMELKGTGVRTLALLTPGIDTRMLKEMDSKYGNYFDPPSGGKIPAETFAQAVLDAIESDRSELLPEGSTRIGLFLSRHVPALFRRVTVRDYSRSPISK